MNIVSPKATLWKQGNNHISHIARCARVCYASENNTNSFRLFQSLIDRGHRSMLRHSGVYYKIPCKLDIDSKYMSYINKRLVGDIWYLSTNSQVASEALNKYYKYQISYEEAISDSIFVKHKMIYYTFCIETGIDITREFNRKSPNAIAEQSTRYVDFIKKIGIRFKECHWMKSLNFYKYLLVKIMCKVDEWFYKISRSKYGLNLRPEDARWCLFLDTMSKAVYTYTVKEWEDIINMRLFDYTGVAHKDAKVIAEQIFNQLTEVGYIIINKKDIIESISGVK